MPTAATIAARIRELDLPSPPSKLVALVRGKRDRVPPEAKVLAVEVGLKWNGVRADVIAETRDREKREKAIKADKLNVLREVIDAFESGQEPPADALGERTHVSKRTLLELSAQRLDNGVRVPSYHERRAVFALLYGEGHLQPAIKPRRMQRHRFIDYEVLWPQSLDILPSEMGAVWERFEAWKSTLKGGGVSIAAELAGVSRAAASKWLIELEEPLTRFNYEEEERYDEEWERMHDEWVSRLLLNPDAPPPGYPPPTFSSEVGRLIYTLYAEMATYQQGE